MLQQPIGMSLTSIIYTILVLVYPVSCSSSRTTVALTHPAIKTRQPKANKTKSLPRTKIAMQREWAAESERSTLIPSPQSREMQGQSGSGKDRQRYHGSLAAKAKS